MCNRPTAVVGPDIAIGQKVSRSEVQYIEDVAYRSCNITRNLLMKSAKLFYKGRRQISSFMISRFAPVQAWLTAQEQNDSKFLDLKLILRVLRWPYLLSGGKCKPRIREP